MIEGEANQFCQTNFIQLTDYEKLIKEESVEEPESFQEKTTFTCPYVTYALKVFKGALPMRDKSSLCVQEKTTFTCPYGTFTFFGGCLSAYVMHQRHFKGV